MPTVTPTPMASSARGPQVSFFGVVNLDGCFACDQLSCLCAGMPTPNPGFDALGRRIFERRAGQFLIVVEGKPGTSGMSVGTTLLTNPTDRPDLQIESDRQLGNGSAAVCDTGAGGGGVPGIAPPNFGPGQTVTDVLRDFACRFGVVQSPINACTLDPSGNVAFLSPNPAQVTAQFCDAVSTTAQFPPGESVLTVQLRDTAKNLGPTAQIVVRVATPTPTP